MHALMNHMVLFFATICIILLASSYAGLLIQERQRETMAASSFKTLESAVLGLLALLLGFSFSMAVSRYDLRRQLEVEEANSIGTTWLRTETLPEPARSTERQLLRQYVPIRLDFFNAGTDQLAITRSLADGGALQQKIWDVAAADASIHRDPISSLFLSTLNDSIDATEKRTAAFENRIPAAAWILLLLVAGVSSLLVGMGASKRSRGLLLALPLVVACAMTLILDLDSPRSGLVRVPQNSMERVAAQVEASR